MYRVLLAAGILALLSGCSLNSSSLSSGFAGSDSDTASLRRPASSRQGSLGGEPTVRATPASAAPQRLAKLDDKAPQGSYERAPAGALGDRNYAATQLDADKARELINAYRKEKGLKPLKLNAELSNAAKAHSRDLAKWDRISHYGSDGSNPWDRVKRAGYNARLAAENVGTGQASIDEVFKGWKESPGHNKNLLLTDAEHMGIALVQEPKTEFKTFWTLVVGSPL
ncbi:MAG: CAP domain-containing protein [Hyphomicrobiaceae bacterium]